MDHLNKAGYAIGEDDVFLELGTGYAIVEALTMILLGAKKVITVDITKDIRFNETIKYLQMLSEEHVNNIARRSTRAETQIAKIINELKICKSLEELLQRAGITYVAPYRIADLEVYAGQVTVCYSQVVLEHIPETVMRNIFTASKKFLGDKGLHSHIVNLTDHFRNPGFFRDNGITDVNFLRYSDKYWNFWCGNDIAYVNRLRFPFYITMFQELGFDIVDVDKQKDKSRMNELLSYEEIHENVRSKYDERSLMDSLWVQRFHIVCRKNDNTTLSVDR